LIQLDPSGLGCEKGHFHVGPWRPEEKAMITHGHADHARSGSSIYYCADKFGDERVWLRLPPTLHSSIIGYYCHTLVYWREDLN